MESFDLRKKRETESAKARLDATKKKLAEILTTISKSEAEQQEMVQQWDRKIKDLRNTEGSQYLRISKLNADLESMRTLLQSRTDEHAALIKVNLDLKEELKVVQEEIVTQDQEYYNMLEQLEDKVKEGYNELQTAKDVEALMEVSMGSLGEEERLCYLKDLLKKRKLRQCEIDAERDELEGIHRQLEIEFKAKTNELEVLRDKNDSLSRIYNMSKKVTEEQ